MEVTGDALAQRRFEQPAFFAEEFRLAFPGAEVRHITGPNGTSRIKVLHEDPGNAEDGDGFEIRVDKLAFLEDTYVYRVDTYMEGSPSSSFGYSAARFAKSDTKFWTNMSALYLLYCHNDPYEG